MTDGRFQFTSRVVSAGATSQDDVLVAHRDGVDVVAVADGAGNSTQSLRAARLVLDAIVALSIEALTNADESFLVRLLSTADREISDAQCGETTAVVCILRRDEIIGASVGDSGAWIITDADKVDLTAHQRRKPLLGSGAAIVIPFRQSWNAGHLLVASDGLLKYAQPQAICEVVRADGFEALGDRLLRLVQLRSGGYQDDVAIAVARRNPSPR